jgi:outer membrane protein
MRDYKRFVQDAQDEVKRKEAQLTEEILKELRKVIDEIGKKENFTLILEKVEGVVLYIDETVDITQKVIETYNKKIKKNK